VIKRIYQTLSGDEARHAGAYFKYMRRAIEKLGDEAKLAFAKIGILMASAARAGRPMHPTSLHVNKAMFPNDTVQSRLPDAKWLENWLDHQIRFDKVCESKVVGSILAKLGTLCDRTLANALDLKTFRRELLARAQGTSPA
jgi:hypothetical protein